MATNTKHCNLPKSPYKNTIRFLQSPKQLRQFKARISQLAMMADLPDDLKPDFAEPTTCHHEWPK